MKKKYPEAFWKSYSNPHGTFFLTHETVGCSSWFKDCERICVGSICLYSLVLLWIIILCIPLHWEDPLEKGKATHSNILAWRIPWTV